MSSVYCDGCHIPIPSEAKICPYCSTPSTATRKAPPPVTAPVSPPPSPKVEGKPRLATSTGIVFIALGITGVVVGGLVLLALGLLGYARITRLLQIFLSNGLAGLFVLAGGLVGIAAGYGLRNAREWGAALGVIVCSAAIPVAIVGIVLVPEFGMMLVALATADATVLAFAVQAWRRLRERPQTEA